MKKLWLLNGVALFLLALLPSVSFSAFRTDWLQNITSSITLNGTTYYWTAGPGSSGQFLTTDGAVKPTLTWTTVANQAVSLSTLTAGATNFIFNQSILQGGSTFYVSSGTVSGLLTATTGYFGFGSETVPSISFFGDPDTGLGRTASDNLGLFTGGGLRWFLNGSGTLKASAGLTLAIHNSDGLAIQPSYSFNSDEDTGIFRAGVNTVGIAGNSSTLATFAPSGFFFSSGTITGPLFVNGLLTGTTIYVSSGTVEGQFNVISATATGFGAIREYFSFNPRNSSFSPNSNLTLNMVGNSGFVLRGANLDTSAYTDLAIIPPIAGNTILTSVSANSGNELMSVRLDEVRISTKVVINNNRSLEFYDSDNTNFAGLISSASLITNNTYVLPPSSGTANQTIVTDGSNNFAFKDIRSAMKFSEVFNAEQGKLPTTNPCVISNAGSLTVPALLCDASTDESVTWPTILTEYTTTTIAVSIYYTMASAASGNVVHNISVMCASTTYTTDLDTESFATVNASTISVPSVAGRIGVATMTLTNMDTGCVQGGLIIFKYTRDANSASDTAAGDIEIRKIWAREP